MNQELIVILGSQGQVGRDLVTLLLKDKSNFVAWSRKEADLLSPDAIIGELEKINPTALINAAAYTNVDLAEKEKDLAFDINAEAPEALSQWCAEKDIPFITYSTDYVFASDHTDPQGEDDPVCPLNIYGQSKLAGERSVERAQGKYLIFRTSWVYSSVGKNFVNTMIRLGKEREELKVVSDQVGAPTYSYHLAEMTLKALKRAKEMPHFPSGVYHACNQGETTWNGFAKEIFNLASSYGEKLQVKRVLPITTAEYVTPAKRPLNSRLSTKKLSDTFGLNLPPWHQGLEECMDLRK